MSEPETNGRFVIVTTKHKGVFGGYPDGPTDGDSVRLKRARMAIRFGTTRGLMELAETGPTPSTKLSARADLDIRDVTAVIECTPEAVAGWEAR